MKYIAIAILLVTSCTAPRGTCLQQSLTLCDELRRNGTPADIVVYQRGPVMHAVVRTGDVYRDPAFRTTRTELDGKYLFKITETEQWR